MERFSLLKNFLYSQAFKTFSNEEKELGERIFLEACDELEKVQLNKAFKNSCSDECSDDEDLTLDEKMEIIKINMWRISEILEQAGKARTSFKRGFPKWSKLRRQIFKKLREIADEINKDRKNCNYSKVASSAVGIAGGTAVIVGIVAPIVAPAVLIGGAVASGLGGATVVGTSVTEMKLLRDCMSEACELLKKDEENFKLIKRWFEHTENLIKAFEKSVGFDAAKLIYEKLKVYGADLSKEMKSNNGLFPKELKNSIGICIQNIWLKSSSTLGEYIHIIPIVITFIFIVVLFRKHNSITFNSILLSHRTALELLKIVDVSIDLGMSIANATIQTGTVAAQSTVAAKSAITAKSAVVAKSTMVATNATATMLTYGIFAGLGLALDLTNMMLASIDLHKGSISSKAVELQNAADQLEKEYNTLDSVYKTIFPEEWKSLHQIEKEEEKLQKID